MCGIAGVMFFDGRRSVEAEQCAARMLQALRHRGPDGSGLTVSLLHDGPTVALAHARLAIIDLSDAGAQPMSGPAGTRVTFNGEIFNYRALQAALEAEGAAFKTQSDTEALLQAYAVWGEDAWARLEGMFALGLWDPVAGSLRLVRDRLGIKPLYYAVTPDAVVFASEVRAILASGLVAGKLDGGSLWHYLGYQTAGTPATLVAGVRMLEPASCLTIDARGRQHTREYWQVLGQPSTARTRDEALGRVRELVENAVTSHMVSDVPVGVFLSGGIDSGALVSALASAGQTPRTFSVAVDDPRHDESATAREVAQQFGAEHTEIALSGETMFEMLPDVLANVDHPSGDGVNSYVVSTLVRSRGFKVALSGLGGDEVFGGYASFRRLSRMSPWLRTWGRSPAPVRQAAAGLVRSLGAGTTGVKAAALLESDGATARTWPVTRQVFSVEQRDALLPGAAERLAEPDAYAALLDRVFGAHPEADLWSRVSFAELRTYMHDVLLRDTDQMSMAHALEVRVPLLDHRLVHYVVNLPARFKADGSPKALLAESLARPLPASVTARPKRGFVLPFETWMRGALRPFCEAHVAQADARGIFAPGEVSRVWTRFLNRELSWSRAWTLIALESWMTRHHIEQVVW